MFINLVNSYNRSYIFNEDCNLNGFSIDFWFIFHYTEQIVTEYNRVKFSAKLLIQFNYSRSRSLTIFQPLFHYVPEEYEKFHILPLTFLFQIPNIFY